MLGRASSFALSGTGSLSGPGIRPHVVVLRDAGMFGPVQPAMGSGPVITLAGLGGLEERLERLRRRLRRARSAGRGRRASRLERRIERLESGGDRGRAGKDLLAWAFALPTGGASVAYRYATRGNWRYKSKGRRSTFDTALPADVGPSATDMLAEGGPVPGEAAALTRSEGPIPIEQAAPEGESSFPWLAVGGGLLVLLLVGGGIFAATRGSRSPRVAPTRPSERLSLGAA